MTSRSTRSKEFLDLVQAVGPLPTSFLAGAPDSQDVVDVVRKRVDDHLALLASVSHVTAEHIGTEVLVPIAELEWLLTEIKRLRAEKKET